MQERLTAGVLCNFLTRLIRYPNMAFHSYITVKNVGLVNLMTSGNKLSRERCNLKSIEDRMKTPLFLNSWRL